MVANASVRLHDASASDTAAPASAMLCYHLRGKRLLQGGSPTLGWVGFRHYRFEKRLLQGGSPTFVCECFQRMAAAWGDEFYKY